MEKDPKTRPVGSKMRAACLHIAMNPGVSEYEVDINFGRGTTNRLLDRKMITAEQHEHGRKLKIVDSGEEAPIWTLSSRVIEKLGQSPSTAPKSEKDKIVEFLRNFRDLLGIPCSRCESDPWEPCTSAKTGHECAPHYERLAAYIYHLVQLNPHLNTDINQ